MITVAGEALIDLVGDGVTFDAKLGGSPFNVAVGLARLGASCEFLGRLSRDSFGVRLRRHLKQHGVSLRAAVEADEPTTLAIATLDEHGAASYEFYVTGTADWQWRHAEIPERLPDDVAALHTGSLALLVEPGASLLEHLLRREHARGAVTISIDPNLRPLLERDARSARHRVERQIRYAHLVKASAEDLAWLYPGEEPERVARKWRELGPPVVVVTLGADGALAVGPRNAPMTVAAPRVAVVDTVGAGDAFTAALLSGLAERDLLVTVRGVPGSSEAGQGAMTEDAAELLDDALPDLLGRACAAAAITCQRAGADPPTAAELAR